MFLVFLFLECVQNFTVVEKHMLNTYIICKTHIYIAYADRLFVMYVTYILNKLNVTVND